jgi:hypothetical protein
MALPEFKILALLVYWLLVQIRNGILDINANEKATYKFPSATMLLFTEVRNYLIKSFYIIYQSFLGLILHIVGTHPRN